MRDSLLVFEQILSALEDHPELYDEMEARRKELVEIRKYAAPEMARDWSFLNTITNKTIENQGWKLRKKIGEILTNAPVTMLEEVYEDRNRLAQLCVKLAQMQGMAAGVRKGVEGQDDQWPVLMIVLPEVGEVAWHIPREELICEDVVDVPYDGHTSAEKAARICQFLKK